MMVSRGRGHVSTDRREQLRRPAVSPLESIAMKIAALDITLPEEVENVGREIAKYCVTIDKLKLMVNDLHERSLVSRKFGAKCAVALATQSQLTVDGKKLRALLMSNIQTDFEDKENLRHHNMNRYLNTFSFIGEVFRHIRLVDGAPISVLAAALIEYCQMLIVGSEPEVELCVQQLAYNGKLLKQWHPQQLTALQLQIRKAVMVPGTDTRSLCWLQLASDLDRFNYEQLSTEWCELYKTKLGTEPMDNIVQIMAAPEPAAPEPAAPVRAAPAEVTRDVKATNDVIVSRQPEQASRSPSERAHNDRRSASSSGRRDGSGDAGYAPRAARSKDPRNDPANWLPRHEPMSEKDRGIWGNSRQRGNNSWGHDDRFDRDYNSRAGATQEQANTNNQEESWD